jgi:hypothetical protein
VSTGMIIALAVAIASSGPPAAKEHRSRWGNAGVSARASLPVHVANKRSLPRLPEGSHNPLACGGADTVANLQWQPVAAAKAKDRWELRVCGH